MTCAHVENYHVCKKDSVEIFIIICAIFVHELGQHQPNNLISKSSLTITRRVVNHITNVSKQKMNDKDLDDIVDEMGTLVIDQSQQEIEFETHK